MLLALREKLAARTLSPKDFKPVEEVDFYMCQYLYPWCFDRILGQAEGSQQILERKKCVALAGAKEKRAAEEAVSESGCARR